jgi:hypothetical protein
MAHAAYIREKACEMRTERHFTLDQIAERLALPRSTIYYWIRDLPVPNEVTHSDKRQAARRRGNRAMRRKYRLLREAAYREGEEPSTSWPRIRRSGTSWRCISRRGASGIAIEQ